MKKFDLRLKDLVYILIIGVLCFFGYRMYKDLSAQVQQSHTAYKQISETLARAESNTVTRAELEAFAKQMDVDLRAIKGDLSSLGAKLSAVGSTIASVKGKYKANIGSDHTISHESNEQPAMCKLCDVHEYTTAIQVKDIKIGQMPHAKVEFDASHQKPWTIKSDDIDVKVTTVLGEKDKDNTNVFYHTISLLNKSRPELTGKEYKLKVTSSEFVQTVENNKRFYWWAPHLDMSLDNTFAFDNSDATYRFGGSIGISIMGYGRTVDDNDWRFLRVGAGLNSQENPYVILEPVKYNMGRFIPLVSDMFLGVGAVWDSSWGIGISISTTL